VTSLKRFNSYEIFYDGRRKGDLSRQVTSLKRFNSYEIFYDGRGKS
jgi:spore maturation protein SpmB